MMVRPSTTAAGNLIFPYARPSANKLLDDGVVHHHSARAQPWQTAEGTIRSALDWTTDLTGAAVICSVYVRARRVYWYACLCVCVYIKVLKGALKVNNGESQGC